MTKSKFLDIICTMIEWGMLDASRITDEDYVVERVKTYLKARALTIETMNIAGMPLYLNYI